MIILYVLFKKFMSLKKFMLLKTMHELSIQLSHIMLEQNNFKHI